MPKKFKKISKLLEGDATPSLPTSSDSVAPSPEHHEDILTTVSSNDDAAHNDALTSITTVPTDGLDSNEFVKASEEFTQASSEFTQDVLDATHLFVETLQEVADEELGNGWGGWFGESATTAANDLSITTTTTAAPVVEKRRRRKKSRKGGKKKKKKRRTQSKIPVGGHD